MKKGISLISLIITIVVIIILASITIVNSLNTSEDAYIVKNQNEFNDVCVFVRNVSTRVEADLLSFEIPQEMLVTEEQLKEFIVEGSTELTSADIQKIKDVNSSASTKYGYYYITGDKIENGITGLDFDSNITNVDNNYIINFCYGVVIAKISENQVNVMGTIK